MGRASAARSASVGTKRIVLRWFDSRTQSRSALLASRWVEMSPTTASFSR